MTAGTSVSLRDYEARRIALIKPSALGDIVHSLPILSALRRRFPKAYIAWIVNRSYEPLLNGHPDLDETLSFERRPIGGGWLRAGYEFGRFLRQIRSRQFDLVVDLQGLARSGMMTAASRAPRRVGLATAREGARWTYTDVVPVPQPEAMHAVDRYGLVAEALGSPIGPKDFFVPIPESARRWAAEQMHRYPRPWLIFAVGSRWRTKRWLPSHFAALAERAQERFGATIVFVGGAEEASLAKAVESPLTGPVCNLTGQTTLPQLAAVAALADAVVANDTGPLHLAVALGRPVVAPYTCSRVVLTGPYGAEGSAVETTVWCRGSRLKRCGRLDCMRELTPERLWPTLEGHLETWKQSRLSA
jgi:lipopolysaccharide heptosyltransferase I